jgi:hypothetical protein
MKKSTLLSIALLASASIAKAQFNIGINAGVNNPSKSVSDSIPLLRSGYNINIDPSYSFGKFSINSNLGYQSFNIQSAFENMARQKNYTAEKGYIVNSNQPGFLNAALGAGFNVLPSGISECGTRKPSLIIKSQFGILKPVNAANTKVVIDQKATVYSFTQSDKALPYFNAGAEVICPVSSLIAIKSGVSYNQTTGEMAFQQSGNNGTVNNISTAYSNVQFSIGIQVAFKGHNEKGIKRSAAAKNTGQPIGGIVVKGGINADVVQSPLYQAPGTETASPLYEPKSKISGQSGSVSVKTNVQANVIENPVFAQPVGEPQPVLANKAVNPVYNGGNNSGSNPMFEGSALVAGQPIGGIVVKGGKNPGGGLTVLDNGFAIKENGIKSLDTPKPAAKGHSEKGIKRSDFAIKENGIKSMDAPEPAAKGHSEKGIKRSEFAIKENGIKSLDAPEPAAKGHSEKGIKRSDFAIKENGIKSLTTPNNNQTSIEEREMKTQALIYTNDFKVEDPMLLSYLGISELIIQKGEYTFDYSKNPNGELKLNIGTKIIHRDLAARNLVFIGFNPETKKHFEYTIEPVFVNGIANQIQVSYKSTSAN